MAKDVYVVHYTAVVHGMAHYYIPEGDKLKHFVDGSAVIEWNFEDLRNIEAHDYEHIDCIPDEETDEVPVPVDNDDIPF